MNRTFTLIRAAGLALALSCLTATTSKAVVVTVNSVQYDVTSITSNYPSLSSTLQEQVWWGNQSLATSFATAAGLQLGAPNPGSISPLFVWNVSGSDLVARATGTLNTGVFTVLVSNGVNVQAPLTYAVAQLAAVPDSGGTLAMLGTALAGLIALRRRFT
jgi:hypothetical protein